MGMTPLHIAVWRGAPDIVDMLLKAGGDLYVKDKVTVHPCVHTYTFPYPLVCIHTHSLTTCVHAYTHLQTGYDCVEQAEFWSKQETEGMGSPHAQHVQTLTLVKQSC